MELKILGSSSSGNCYLFETEKECLILEAGVRLSQIKEALNFNISKVLGCFFTHEHADHSKYVKDLIATGIDCYSSQGTIEAIGLKSHRLHSLYPMARVEVGSFKVMPFKVKHDAKEPFGYLINHPEMGNTLFLTDSYFVEYKFPGLNNILIEANYSDEILEERINSGKINPFVANRVKTSHMSLETLKDLLNANDLSAVNNIVLLHLSDGNSDAFAFASKICKLTGKTVTVANKKMTINLNKLPF